MEAVLFGLLATPIIYGLLRDLAAVLGPVLDAARVDDAGKSSALDPDPYDIAPCFVVTHGLERPACL